MGAVSGSTGSSFWQRDARIFEPAEEGQPHADPDAPLFVGNDADRTPTTEVPVTPMRDLVFPPDTREVRQAFRAAAGETAPITVPWPVRR